MIIETENKKWRVSGIYSRKF